VVILYLFTNRKPKLTHYFVKGITYLIGKPKGEHSMLLKHFEEMILYPRRNATLILLRTNLNWFKPNSCEARIANTLYNILECIFHVDDYRRINYQSVRESTFIPLRYKEMNEWDSNIVDLYNIATMGLPKSGNAQGNGCFIVSNYLKSKYASLIMKEREGRQFCSISKGISLDHQDHGLRELEKLRNNSKDIKHTNIYTLIKDLDLNIAAYEKIKSKPGNMPASTGKSTLDGISIDNLKDTIKRLHDHTFQFKPSRRLYIAKANGKKRPLGIPSPRDKITQTVMLMILEAI